MKIDLLGISIDNLTKRQVLENIESRLKAVGSIFIVTPYSESIVAAQKDEEFRKILNSADFALPDGIGILWAAKFLHKPSSPGEGRRWRRGRSGTLWELLISLSAIIFNPSYIRSPIPEKISGSEFVWELTELAAKNNYSIFLLGGFNDTPEKAAQALKEKFPNLKIAGFSNASPPSAAGGEGESERGSDVAEKINDSRTDFLLVALGPIRQEKWICKNLPNLRVKLAIGLGGTFDYLAGKRPYRGQFWASRGLEWLWRLLTQPWRLRRVFKGVLGLIYYSCKAKLKS